MTTDGHGGNRNWLAQLAGKAPDEILDFSANINPLGPPDWLRPVISRNLGELIHYPDPQAGALVAAASRRYGAAADEILSGNGSTELLYLLAQVAGTKRAVIPVPCYTDYAHAARLAGMELVSVPIAEKGGFQFEPERLAPLLNAAAAVFIGRPNNPTGQVCPAPSIRTLAQAHPECLFIIDEAFGDFVEDFESLTTNRPPNVIVLLSLTKIFAVPGLRLGCAVADAALAASVRERQPLWSVNTLAQAVGVAALGDADYVARSRSMVREERETLLAELRRIQGLVIYPGAANFLLVRLDSPAPDARTLALMFQGVSSNAGKSVMTAAFCRILLQDGYRVAPFKAQNMSLNSFVTRDGGEMGRAQAVQAQACRVEPDVRMNPVLLKPNSDTGSQVILLGKPVGNMTVSEYIRYKPEAFEAVRQAYDNLATDYDVIVLEGAGSPAEVNLKRSGLAERIVRLAAEGKTEIVGICGGFQMIGKEIHDPQHVESGAGAAVGLELLDVQTVMAVEKTLLRVSARHALSGLEVQGYEIHHGQTSTATLEPLLACPDGEVIGLVTADGRVWGTYLHGIFDADPFRRWFIDRLRVRRGLPAMGRVMANYTIEPALDQLARIVRRSLKMDAIYRLMGL